MATIGELCGQLFRETRISVPSIDWRDFSFATSKCKGPPSSLTDGYFLRFEDGQGPRVSRFSNNIEERCHGH